LAATVKIKAVISVQPLTLLVSKLLVRAGPSYTKSQLYLEN